MTLQTATSVQQPEVLLRYMRSKNLTYGDEGKMSITDVEFWGDEIRFCFISGVSPKRTNRFKLAKQVLPTTVKYRGLEDYSQLGETRYRAEGVKFFVRKRYVLLDFSSASLVAMKA